MNKMNKMNKYVRREDVLKLFDFDPETNKTLCLIPGCKQQLSGKVVSNLKRHIFLKHETVSKQINLVDTNIDIKPPLFDESSNSMDSSSASAQSPVFTRSSRPTIKKRKLDETRFVEGCIKCCTEESVPFQFFNSEAFRMLTEGVTDALGITINAEVMPEKIHIAADNIRSHITEELRHKLFSIKVDAATKLDRGLLGINAQFLRDGVLQVWTLGVIELTQQHTGANLKTKIENLLETYGLSSWQVYSVTTDNGANMVKAVTLLEMDQKDVLEQIDLDFEEIPEKNDQFYVDVANELEGETYQTVLSCIRCVAHSLQLVVSDVAKTCQSELEVIRTFVKQMKIVKYRERYTLSGTPRPILYVDTRWMSTYLMVKNLLDNLDFYKELSDDIDIDCELSASIQEFITNYVKAFTPLYYATKRFQEEQLTMGDFFKYWIQCSMECSEIVDENPSNNFATEILKRMEFRQVKLFENPIFLAAVYMDPRFNYHGSTVLTLEQKKVAIDQIFNTWLLLKQLSPREIRRRDQSQDILILPSNDKLDRYFHKNFSPQDTTTPKIDKNDDDVKLQILNLSSQANSSLSENVLQHWETRRFDDPTLYELSQICLAVPPTQVSVERAFSALELILTSQRSRPADSTINNLLVCKLNSDLFDKN